MPTQAIRTTSDLTVDTMPSQRSHADPTMWLTEVDRPRAAIAGLAQDCPTAPLHPVEVESLRRISVAPPRTTTPADVTVECPASAVAVRSTESSHALLAEVVEAASEVHATVGPGLLEAAYAECLSCELALLGRRAELHVAVPLVYKGRHLAFATRISLVVDGRIAVQIVMDDVLLPEHERRAQGILALTSVEGVMILNLHATSMTYGARWIPRG